MSARAMRAFAIGIVTAAPLLGACTADTPPSASSGAGGSAYSGPSGAAPTGASAQPMLVDVDTDHTMTAQPGEGVGVFTEYSSGGHWHLWWTCDTNKTRLGCNYDVSVSAAGGAIANVAGEMLQTNDLLVQSRADQIDVVTQTSTDLAGVTFDTSPGDTIAVDAMLGGAPNGSLFFFVQDNVINGDYKGTLTDPLMFQPSSP